MSTCPVCRPGLLCAEHRELRLRLVAQRLAALNRRVTLREPR
jgi:hypothetical protein